MKTMVKFLIIMALAVVAWAQTTFQSGMGITGMHPAKGIWITQVGDIVSQPETHATLYYTLFAGGDKDRVKSINYHYNGSGVLRLFDKDTLCGSEGGVSQADGLMHHPDGDLLTAQGGVIYKVKKHAKGEFQKVKSSCLSKKTSSGRYWHLMIDPMDARYVWGTSMPGSPYRHRLYKDGTSGGIEDAGIAVHMYAKDKKHGDRNNQYKTDASTFVWDEDGNAFFTRSDYQGGGCEADVEGNECTDAQKDRFRAGAWFGYITDSMKVTIKNSTDAAKYKGNIGEIVDTAFHSITLLDSLEGAHGATYDPYSKTIFLFGGSKILQVKPYKENGNMKARVVASIDLRTMFFVESNSNLTGPRTSTRNDGSTATLARERAHSKQGKTFTSSLGWRLDQGTVDGKGHLFVACNTGHIIFVDYAANANKLIDNNVLVHMQWIDNYLDDLAPLDIAAAVRDSAGTGSGVSSSSIIRLSSMAEWKESSSSAKSSSSLRSSSSVVPVSSGTNPSSSSNVVPGSSGTNPSSSSNVVPGSSGTNPGSSSSVVPGSSNTDPSSSNGSVNSSSSNSGSGKDYDDESSSSSPYIGFEDYDDEEENGFHFYAKNENYDMGDSIVKEASILKPVAPGGSNTIVIGENTYMISNNPTSTKLDLRENANLDSAQVGQVVAIKLDPEKVKQYFGDSTKLIFKTSEGVQAIDPKNPSNAGKVQVDSDGSVTLYVTAQEAVRNGTITITPEGGGNVVIIDNINFYDPITESKLGYIKDSDNDGKLDYVEVRLKDPMMEGISPVGISLVINGKTISVPGIPSFNEDRNRVFISAAGLKGLPKSGEVPDDATVIVKYMGDDSGLTYIKECSLVEFGSNIIKDAYAIRNSKGMDSLFVEFNVDIIPYDIRTPELLVMLNEQGFDLGQVKKVYLPSKNIVILEGKNMGLKGDKKDSVSLYPMVTFQNMPYITSDEYDRQVPVTVVDRLPVVKNAEYWDLDKNGVLDQVVLQFEKPITAMDLSQIYATFPWYSGRGMAIQMQAQPSDFKLDPKDSTRVIWDVHAVTSLASGVTGISESLSPATIYTYYKVFGENFVTEDAATLVDKMAPVVLGATLNYGKKADTLELVFSEPIKYQKLEGKDFFKYIHGKDTLDLMPQKIEWSTDGKSAKLIIDGSATTILPGDSLMVVRGSEGSIQDNYGNIMGENPQPVVIGGLLNHLVENTTMGTYDSENEVLQTLSSVNLRYMPSSTTKEDMEKEGALGQLVQLGERFVPQLLDRAQISADGSVDPSVLDSLDPEKVFISFVVNYFDHLGQYVNDTLIEVPCNSPKFGGNCLNSDQKVFVNWNFKDRNGRFVGTGVYMVQFRMVVRYEKKKIEEEIKDKWGVRRKRKR